jgi:hypothetical protein
MWEGVLLVLGGSPSLTALTFFGQFRTVELRYRAHRSNENKISHRRVLQQLH